MTILKLDKGIGLRLDVFLAQELEISRSVAQKMIKQGEILVNDKVVSAHYLVKADDKIKTIKVKATQVKSAVLKKDLPKIKIIKETDDYLVVDKPAGLLMHGADNETRTSLVDWLIKKYPEISKVGEDPARPGIVHRLDKDVSGLVVIAKTQKSFDNLKKQFQGRRVIKQYQALVYGDDLPLEGEIRFKMGRSAKGYRMAARPLNQAGKIAITDFTVEHYYYNYALLKVKIKTGRTHQIRAHLAAYNHPVVGDDLYGTNKHKILNKKFNLGRIFLAATDLSFIDLEGERQSFSIELPNELRKVLKNLKINPHFREDKH